MLAKTISQFVLAGYEFVEESKLTLEDKKWIGFTFILSWVFIVIPVKTSHFEFRRLNSGLTIKVERSSPPMSALQDIFLAERKESKEPLPSLALLQETTRKHFQGLKLTKITIVNIRSESMAQQRGVADTSELQEVSQKLKSPSTLVKNDKALPRAYTQLPVSSFVPQNYIYPNKAEQNTATTTKSEKIENTDSTTGSGAVAVVAVPSNATASQSNKNTQPNRSAPLNLPPTQIKVTGSVQLHALTPTGRFFIYREVMGIKKEEGVIALPDGDFSIIVKELSGDIVAQLRAPSGLALGEGRIKLDPYRGKKNIAGLDLKVQPLQSFSPSTFDSGGAVAARETNIHYSKSLMSASSDAKGKFNLPLVDPASTVIMRLSKPNYWNSLYLTHSGEKQNLTVYRSSLVKAVLDIIKKDQPIDESQLEKTGVIWGKVELHGEAVEGARVELADSNAIGPIYFNDYNGIPWPDTKIQKTSKQGSFLFINVQPGVNTIRATIDGKKLQTKIIPVEAKTISPVTIESRRKHSSLLTLVNPFTNRPMTSRVRFSGSETFAQVNENGQLYLNFSTGTDPLFFDIESDDLTVPTRFSCSRYSSAVEAPVVSRNWLDSLRLNLDPGKGMIIGFFKNQAADILIETKERYDIIYFNSFGDVVPAPVVNGGFVAYNLKYGLHQVSMIAQGSDKILFQSVIVDSEFIPTINHSF